MLHGLNGAGEFSVGDVEFGLGESTPLGGGGAGGDLGCDVLVERGVGEEARLDEVGVVLGEIAGELGRGRFVGGVEREGGGDGGLRAEDGEALAGEVGVVVVGVDVREAAVVVDGLREVALLVLVDAASPVERGGNLQATGVAYDLLVHETGGLGVVADAVVHPCGAPVGRGRVGAGGEEADEGGVLHDGLRGVVLEEVHVAAGVESFLEPAAGGKAGDHLGDEGVVGGLVALVAGELGEHVELERGGVVVGVGEALDIAAGEVLELEVADGGVEGEGVAVGGGELGIVAAEGGVFGGGLAVPLGVEEGVGVGFALGGGERLAHGLQLRGGLRGLEGEGLGGVDGAEDGGGVGRVSGELIGAGQGVAEVDLLRLRRVGERNEDL